jgi:hypothetical protein
MIEERRVEDDEWKGEKEKSEAAYSGYERAENMRRKMRPHVSMHSR